MWCAFHTRPNQIKKDSPPKHSNLTVERDGVFLTEISIDWRQRGLVVRALDL